MTKRNFVTFQGEDLPANLRAKAEQENLEFLESFVVDMIPVLWEHEATILQAQISTLILCGQLRGRSPTVSELTRELGRSRSSVQHSVEKLIDRGRVASTVDPEDGRRRILSIPMSMANEIGAIEELFMKFRLKAYRRLKGILDQLEA